MRASTIGREVSDIRDDPYPQLVQSIPVHFASYAVAKALSTQGRDRRKAGRHAVALKLRCVRVANSSDDRRQVIEAW